MALAESLPARELEKFIEDSEGDIAIRTEASS